MPRFPEAETAIFIGKVDSYSPTSNMLVTTNSVSALLHLLELLPARYGWAYSFEFLDAVEFLRDNPVNAQTFVDTIHESFATLGTNYSIGVNAYTRKTYGFKASNTIINTDCLPLLPDRDCRVSLNALGICLTTIKLPKYLFDNNGRLDD